MFGVNLDTKDKYKVSPGRSDTARFVVGQVQRRRFAVLSKVNGFNPKPSSLGRFESIGLSNKLRGGFTN